MKVKPVVKDYLDEYDEYGLEHEKYFVGGQGGKQRSKKDIVQNTKFDPSQNVRVVTSKLQIFELKRRKSSSNSTSSNWTRNKGCVCHKWVDRSPSHVRTPARLRTDSARNEKSSVLQKSKCFFPSSYVFDGLKSKRISHYNFCFSFLQKILASISLDIFQFSVILLIV